MGCYSYRYYGCCGSLVVDSYYGCDSLVVEDQDARGRMDRSTDLCADASLQLEHYVVHPIHTCQGTAWGTEQGTAQCLVQGTQGAQGAVQLNYWKKRQEMIEREREGKKKPK